MTPPLVREIDTGSLFPNYLANLWYGISNLVAQGINLPFNLMAGLEMALRRLGFSELEIQALYLLPPAEAEGLAQALAKECKALPALLREIAAGSLFGPSERAVAATAEAYRTEERILDIVLRFLRDKRGALRIGPRPEPALKNAVWTESGWLRSNKSLESQPWLQYERHVQRTYRRPIDQGLYAADVEFDTFVVEGSEKVLIDAKYGFARGWYDVSDLLTLNVKGSPPRVLSPRNFARSDAIAATVQRQLGALVDTGATQIRWPVPDKEVAAALNEAFAGMGDLKVRGQSITVKDKIQAVYLAPSNKLPKPKVSK